MIDVNIINQYLASIAAFITSLGVILGAFYKWIWKPYAKKKVEREKQWQADMKEIAQVQTLPISEQLGLLEKQTKRHDETNEKLEAIAEQNVVIIREMRQEFKEHDYHAKQRDDLIAQNAEIIKNHEQRLDAHNERLLFLETVSGMKNNPQTIKNRKGEENETE